MWSYLINLVRYLPLYECTLIYIQMILVHKILLVNARYMYYSTVFMLYSIKLFYIPILIDKKADGKHIIEVGANR